MNPQAIKEVRKELHVAELALKTALGITMSKFNKYHPDIEVNISIQSISETSSSGEKNTIGFDISTNLSIKN